MSPVFKLFSSFYRFLWIFGCTVDNHYKYEKYSYLQKKNFYAHIKNTKYSVNKRK